MALEFYNLIKHHANKAPDHPSIIDGETTVTYAELLEQVEHFAGGLSNLELNSQSKLGLLCLNQKEYLVALMGAFLKGLPVIPYNFLLTPKDLIYITKTPVSTLLSLTQHLSNQKLFHLSNPLKIKL